MKNILILFVFSLLPLKANAGAWEQSKINSMKNLKQVVIVADYQTKDGPTGLDEVYLIGLIKPKLESLGIKVYTADTMNEIKVPVLFGINLLGVKYTKPAVYVGMFKMTINEGAHTDREPKIPVTPITWENAMPIAAEDEKQFKEQVQFFANKMMADFSDLYKKSNPSNK